MRLPAPIIFTLVLSACGSDDTAGQDGGEGTAAVTTSGSTSGPLSTVDATTASRTETDEGSDPDTGSSTGTTKDDTGGELSCFSPVLGETLTLDPDGPDGQIHPSVWFDAESEGVWVVYNAPNNAGLFDVFVTRVGCDGITQVAPTQVNHTPEHNDVDPDIVRDGDRMIVVWTSDDGSGGDSNLGIALQSIDLDGTPQLEDDRVLETSLGAVPFVGNAWMPRLAAGELGGLAVIGTRANEAANAFQVFVQRLGPDAVSEGPTAAFDGLTASHTTPHAALNSAGDVLAAWVSTEDSVLHQIEVGRMSGDDEFDTRVPTVVVADNSSAPAIVVSPPQVYMARAVGAGGSGQIQVARGLGLDSPTTLVNDDGTPQHTPAMAPMPEGAALAWYRNMGGFANALLVARVHDDEAALVVDPPIVVPDAIAAPYATTVTHVTDELVFVAWTQGTSPAFRIYGRFVDLGDKAPRRPALPPMSDL